jgi:hypothetical protein
VSVVFGISRLSDPHRTGQLRCEKGGTDLITVSEEVKRVENEHPPLPHSARIGPILNGGRFLWPLPEKSQ